MHVTAVPIRRRVNSGQWLSPPKQAAALRLSIVSDAILGRNGVGTYYLDLMQHLQPYVAHVQLVAPEEVPNRNLERFALPMPGDPTQRMAWPRRAALEAILDRDRPHLVVIPSLGAFSYYALRYAQRKRLPVAIVHHTNFDYLLSLYWPSMVAFPFRKGLRLLNRWLCRQAAAVAAMNADALHEAVDANAKLIRVMGTPLASEFLRTPIHELPAEVSQAVFIGRLAKEKGIPQILGAARQLPKIQFTIAGDGPLRSEVVRMQKQCENVRYLGWIPRSRVLEEIDRAQMLLLPSKFETFGTVALEALARRRLVLASSECGIAKWSSVAEGIFRMTPEKCLADLIGEVRDMGPARRIAIAEKSWRAVRAFNDHTVRNWLKFLVEAAGLYREGGKDAAPTMPHASAVDEVPVA